MLARVSVSDAQEIICSLSFKL